jgi:hypothetical protein
MVGRERVLTEDVTVGVAVDLDKRSIRFSTNGVWDETPAFEGSDIDKGLALYPALSLQGRASFALGPQFKHGPPSTDSGFMQWPGTIGGSVRVDCPELGNCENIASIKELQVHGEVHLKRNVQRLVANNKYREAPKTQRSLNLRVLNAGPSSGSYRRRPTQAGCSFYKSDAGGTIHWDPAAELWKISDTDNVAIASAPKDPQNPEDPPHRSWKVLDEKWGILDAGAFKAAVVDSGLEAESAMRITKALLAKDVSPPQVLKVNGSTSLAEQWQQLSDPPISADEVWEKGIMMAQAEAMAESGVPDSGQVVETPTHPYNTESHTWQQEVKIPGALELTVHFASQTCTVQHRGKLTINAGGIEREAMGPGIRVEIPVGGDKVSGTVVAKTEASGASGSSLTWRVRLDRMSGHLKRDGTEVVALERTEDVFQPKVGETVEARFVSGVWYKATVAEVKKGDIDWFDAKRKPQTYVVTWTDGESGDVEKMRHEVRPPRKGLPTEAGTLEALPRYGSVPRDEDECFAYCHDEPKVVMVAYTSSGDAAKKKEQPESKEKGEAKTDEGGELDPATEQEQESPAEEGEVKRVGDEIAEFQLDRTMPLTPFSVKSFRRSGPAQVEGVEPGWYLDIVATILKASKKEAFLSLLTGIGGISRHSVGEVNCEDASLLQHRLERLLDAAFDGNLEELLDRLNTGLLEMTDVTLIFTNSPSLQPLKLLQEAYVTYGPDSRVGNEIQLFKLGPQKQIQIETWLKTSGPARGAGVRTDWEVDLDKTRQENPDKAAQLTKEVLTENPNALLAMSNLTLVFKLANSQKVQVFEGSGPGPPATAPTWKRTDLPGCSAVFNFKNLGDNEDNSNQRWGVWALVVPKELPSQPSRQQIDALAEKWVGIGSRARGIQGELRIEPDNWDEARLRALCARHGWEFEWMAEDGERERRANERQAFFNGAEGLTGARQVAEKAAKVQKYDVTAAKSVTAPKKEARQEAEEPPAEDAAGGGGRQGASAEEPTAEILIGV